MKPDNTCSYCTACNGSGEGSYSRSSCPVCKGSGVQPYRSQQQEVKQALAERQAEFKQYGY